MQVNKISMTANTKQLTPNISSPQANLSAKNKINTVGDTVAFGNIINNLTPETKGMLEIAMDALKKTGMKQINAALDGINIFFFRPNSREAGILVKDSKGKFIDLVQFSDGKAMKLTSAISDKSIAAKVDIDEFGANARAQGYLNALLSPIITQAN